MKTLEAVLRVSHNRHLFHSINAGIVYAQIAGGIHVITTHTLPSSYMYMCTMYIFVHMKAA